MGYLDSLQRRFAALDDITVNNILFSNKDSAKRIIGAEDVFSQMARETKGTAKKFDRIETIPVETFLKSVLPGAEELEVYVENKHSGNFVSLIAPVNRESKTMFKWGNNFCWSYTGNVTDSMMKKRVKAAGGAIDGDLRFSIQWNDLDTGKDNTDLDAHCRTPNKEIYFGNKVERQSGGNLDVDITHPEQAVAVENITFPDRRRMNPGKYLFFVHNYANRGNHHGFRAEIEFDGKIRSYNYDRPIRDNARVNVAEVTLGSNGEFTIKDLLPSSECSVDIWNVKTNTFVPVSVVCFSPNYWDEQNGIGNKHLFFMLKDCRNPEMPNGFFNEFLKEELLTHKRVFEALSSRMAVSDTEDQLSGLGFCFTKRNDLVVKVKSASIERVIKVQF